jgi:site-specific recombinase XerD
MPERITLPALSALPDCIPPDIAKTIAHQKGFRTIADADGVPIPAVGHFLRDLTSESTRNAYREDVAEFLLALEDSYGVEFADATFTQPLFTAYLKSLCTTFGQNGRKRRKSTVTRRMAGLSKFFQHAHKAGHIDVRFDWKQINRIPSDLFKSSTISDARRLLTGRSKKVRFIPSRHVALILSEFGPTLSENSIVGDHWKSIRNRLTAEISYSSGTRIDEVTHLLVNQIPRPRQFDPGRAYDPDFEFWLRDQPHVPVRLAWTKGLVERTCLIPADLQWAVWWYIEVERARVMEDARKRLGRDEWLRRCFDESGRSGWLFVNGSAAADAYVGGRFADNTLSKVMAKCVVRAGLFTEEVIPDPEDGKPIPVVIPSYSFHDWRHTFAILQYLAKWIHGGRTSAAEDAAIRHVQTLLGHASPETTRKWYLEVSRKCEAEISDSFENRFSGLRGVE